MVTCALNGRYLQDSTNLQIQKVYVAEVEEEEGKKEEEVEEEEEDLEGFIDHDSIDADDPYRVVNQQQQQEETNSEKEVNCEDGGIVYPSK